jgi:iron(III) transport system ATP-binding protein
LIGDTVVSTPEQQIPPERRHVGIVFQSYALWPHMTVAENVAYGLTVAGVKDPERAKRVHAALALVELEGFAERRPALLSGGQRQRVALARCLVTEPSLVLLDEPLANLDVHLRAAMEREFADFHERTGTTMIYITHDQTEAMALADRIAVMVDGRVLQFATPSQLYREPADATVARFIGEGIILPVRVLGADGGATCDAEVFGHRLRMRCRQAQEPGSASACVRASALSIVSPGSPGFRAQVTGMSYQGGHFRVEANVEIDPQTTLHLTVAEPSTLVPGAIIDLAVGDGWVIPRTAEA